MSKTNICPTNHNMCFYTPLWLYVEGNFFLFYKDIRKKIKVLKKEMCLVLLCISYRREVGGHSITVDRHLNQLYPFMGVEKAEPEEQIRGLIKDGAAGILAQDATTQLGDAQDEFANWILWILRQSSSSDFQLFHFLFITTSPMLQFNLILNLFEFSIIQNLVLDSLISHFSLC